MIDTLGLSLDEEVPYADLEIAQFNEASRPSKFKGWTARLQTTKPGSYYFTQLRAKSIITLRDSGSALVCSGPLIENPNGCHWLCMDCRINVPKLAALPLGWVPTTDEELRRSLAAVRCFVPFLPAGWLERARVKEVHLCMNFEFKGTFSGDQVMESHGLMRHSGIRSDPAKFNPKHGSLYWKGKNMVIALYDKTRELQEAALKREKKTRVKVPLPTPPRNEILRMEFRLKAPAISKLLNTYLSDVSHWTGEFAPPPQSAQSASNNIAVSVLSADALVWMFRAVASGFTNLPVRTPQRFTVNALIARLIREGTFVGSDAIPIAEYAAQFMNDRQLRDVKKMAGGLSATFPHFSWSDVLGEAGYGTYAGPQPACFLDYDPRH